MYIMKLEAHLNDAYLLLVYCSHSVYKSIMIIFLRVSLILLINQENIVIQRHLLEMDLLYRRQ